MRKSIKIKVFSWLVAIGAASAVYAQSIVNQLADEGFEGISGNEPNVSTFPWFTSGEGSDGSFICDTNRSHSGSQSGQFKFY